MLNSGKFEKGDEVIYVGKYKTLARYYPKQGTIGTILGEDRYGTCYIQWQKGSTSKDDKWYWYCDRKDLRLVCDDCF